MDLILEVGQFNDDFSSLSIRINGEVRPIWSGLKASNARLVTMVQDQIRRRGVSKIEVHGVGMMRGVPDMIRDLEDAPLVQAFGR